MFLRLTCRQSGGGEKLTQHRFSEERKRGGENKPGQDSEEGSKSDLEGTEKLQGLRD